jgi:Ala-tRNA(Pro) deacylase
MKLEEFLQQHGVEYERHTHPITYTSQGLAQIEHVSGYVVAKPVIVKGSQGYVMCVLPAPEHLNLERLAGVLNDPPLRLATEAEMAELFQDCDLGAEAPIGALYGMRTVADNRLREDEYLIMQAGTHTEAIKVRRADWEAVCQPTFGAIAGR